MAESDKSADLWTGQDLHDLDGNRIGKIVDVRYGDVTGGLRWLVVDPGFPGGKKVFVPAAEVRRSGDRLSTLHNKDRVKDAPKVEDEQAPSQVEEAKLCRYYGLQYGAAPDQPAEGCEDMKDVRPAG